MSALAVQTEREFQDQITELAEILGWSWCHFRPAKTLKGWRTPVSGPLGKGFPDLMLCHPGQRRIIHAELKVDEPVTHDQQRVLRVIADSGREAYVWRPEQWDEIVSVLRGR